MLSWSEEARYSLSFAAQRPQKLKGKRGKLYLEMSLLCRLQGGIHGSVCKGTCPSLPKCMDCPCLSLCTDHTSGAAPLVLLSFICPSMAKLGASWLVDNIVLVQGHALIFYLNTVYSHVIDNSYYLLDLTYWTKCPKWPGKRAIGIKGHWDQSCWWFIYVVDYYDGNSFFW